MMIELSPNHYERVKPVIQASGMHGHLALVYELLEGRRSGQIYVDDADNPRTVILCNPVGFFFAFGRPDEDLVRPQIEWLYVHHSAENYTDLFGSTHAWDEPLRRIFAPLGAKFEPRLSFELRDPPREACPVPDGFTLEPLAVPLAQSILDGSGTGGFGIDPWFIRIAGGPQGYAAPRLGMALTREGQIASICGYCGLGHGEAEMEVGTTPAYRGRGLAAIVSQGFMEQCRAAGWKPAYTCTSDNAASRSVAHKLGFVEVEEVHGYKLGPVGR